MLVTGAEVCHLLSHTVSQGSSVFQIPLHKQWCNQMLRWVAAINTQYVIPGIQPPANMCWDQADYKAFVLMTRDACLELVNTSKGVQSWNGPASLWPVFGPTAPQRMPSAPPRLPSPDPNASVVPDTAVDTVPDSDPTLVPDSGVSQMHEVVPDTQEQLEHWPKQLRQEHSEQSGCRQTAAGLQSAGQTQHWQHQQQEQPQMALRPAHHHRYHQQHPQPQLHQQQQQLTGQEQTGQPHQQDQQPHLQLSPLPPQDASIPAVTNAFLAQSGQAAALSSAAAVALPDSDSPMPEADAQVDAHAEAAADETDQRGPIGFAGLASCVHDMLQRYQVDLRAALDETCHAALSLLNAVDVKGLLNRLAKDMKAGWPNKPSALCMARLRAFTAPGASPERPAHGTTAPSEASPSGPAHQPGPMSLVPSHAHAPMQVVHSGPAPATPPPGLAASAPPAPAFAHAPTGHAAASFCASTVPVPSIQQTPTGHDRVQHPHSLTCKQALPPANAVPSPPAATRAAAAVTSHWQTPDSNKSRQQGAASSAGQQPGYQQVPSSPRGMHHQAGSSHPATAAVMVLPQPGLHVPFLPHGGMHAPFNPHPGLPMPFDPHQVANLSDGVKQELYRLVRTGHHQLQASDFDSGIIGRLASMPENQAIDLLQRLNNTQWSEVRNKTRYIMACCCNT